MYTSQSAHPLTRAHIPSPHDAYPTHPQNVFIIQMFGKDVLCTVRVRVGRDRSNLSAIINAAFGLSFCFLSIKGTHHLPLAFVSPLARACSVFVIEIVWLAISLS